MQRTEQNLTWMGEIPVVDEPHSWLSRRLFGERRLAELERAC